MDEHALAPEARLAGVPVAADDHRLDRGVDIGVGADDHGVGAAELEGYALEAGCGELGDVAPDRGRAGERDASDVGVADERVADVACRGP